MRRILRAIVCILALGGSYSSLAGAELDKRYASMECSEMESPRRIVCDYRHSPSVKVNQIRGKVDNKEIQLDQKLVKAFPYGNEASAVLFLIDVSDSKREATIRETVIPSLRSFFEHKKPHQSAGLAVFDSNLRLLAPISSDSETALATLADVKVEGLATEFFKSLLTGIEVLSGFDAARKTLVIFSDGKAEDTSYSRTDILLAAKLSGTAILSVGLPEKSGDSIYLQTLERLAKETYGLYLNGKTKTLAADLTSTLDLMESGGRIIIPAENLFGPQQVELLFEVDGDQQLSLTQSITTTDPRPLYLRVIESFSRYAVYWITGFLFFISVLIFGRKFFQNRARASRDKLPFGFLVELDSKGSRHALRGTASRLGRGKGNDLVLSNETVSLNHAEICLRRDGSVRIVDLSSSNGVILNSIQVVDSIIKSGDVIEIGELRFRFEGMEG